MKASEKVFCLVFSIGAMILLISVLGYTYLYFTKSRNIEKDDTEQNIRAKSSVQHNLDTTDTLTVSATKLQTTTDKTSTLLSTSNGELDDHYQCDTLARGFANVSEIGDGVCHDYFNHIHCQFDGGDCCLSSVLTSVCKICQCFDEIPCKLRFIFWI